MAPASSSSSASRAAALATVVAAALVGNSAAFAPHHVGGLSALSSRGSSTGYSSSSSSSSSSSRRFAAAAATKPRRSPLRASPASAAVSMGLNLGALKWVAALPTMYGLMSVNEYFTHRYYQHAEYNRDRFFQWLAKTCNLPKRIRGGGHVEHHAETYDDMLLKTDDAQWMKSPAAKSLNDDPWRGTAFTWKVTGQMTVQMLFTTLPVFMGVLRFSLAQTVAMLLPGMLLHALVWNALHPGMHGLPDVPLKVGAPTSVFRPFLNSWYFRYLYQNHEGHHVLGGQVNYNVACPLTDHIVGTYVKQASWRPRVDAFLAKKAAKKQEKQAASQEPILA